MTPKRVVYVSKRSSLVYKALIAQCHDIKPNSILTEGVVKYHAHFLPKKTYHTYHICYIKNLNSTMKRT